MVDSDAILTTLWRHRELVGVLLKRTTLARYRGAALGYAWTMLSPLLLMAVYTVVFSLYLRVPLEDYPVFLFSAFIPWLWFANSLPEGTQALLGGANLIARSRLDVETLPAVAVLSGLVHCLLSLPIVVAVALLAGRPLGLSLAALPLLLALQLLLTLGPTILLATWNVYLRDIQQIIPTVVQALFFASPILYPASVVPEPLRLLLHLNPWTYLARSYQRVLYEGRFPAATDLVVIAALAAAVHLTCESAFRGYRHRLAEELDVDLILFEHVSKRFRRAGVTGNYSTLKAILAGVRNRRAVCFEALHDVSFRVAAGETFALVGANGAGKSTVLKLAAGIYQPDDGTLRVDGRVGSLIELGLGFHPDFSGRENVLVCGLLQGMTRREVAARLDEIVEFAALGEFIDEPVRTYSSGMYMRLGFSIAIHCDPAILLIDEVLAVGDAAFQRRCTDRLLLLRAAGKTILMTTHDLGIVRQVCERAAWIDRGRIRAIGDARTVADAYEASVTTSETG